MKLSQMITLVLTVVFLGYGCGQSQDSSNYEDGRWDCPADGPCNDEGAPGEGDIVERIMACPRPDLIEEDFVINDEGLAIYYVDATSDTDGADGTIDHPFATLEQAFESVTAPAKILVAQGEYTFAGDVPVGLHLYGGYDHAFTASDPLNKSVIHPVYTPIAGTDNAFDVNDVLNIKEEPSDIPSSNLTVLDNLDMGEMVVFADETSLVVQNSRTGYISSRYSSLRAVNNDISRTFWSSPDTPVSYGESQGIHVAGSCARVTDNQLVRHQDEYHADPTLGSHIDFWGSEGFITHNTIEYSLGDGIHVMAGSPTIIGNTIHIIDDPRVLTTAPDSNFYSIHLERTAHPVIRDNEIFLDGHRAKGIGEVNLLGDLPDLSPNQNQNADPAELTNNHFHIGTSCTPPVLYTDYDLSGVNPVNHAITDINEVNALSDIPINGRNSVGY